MSWQDFYQRRDVIDAVLRAARRDPAGPLPYTEIPGATAVFPSRDDLLLALHYKWMQQLIGRIGLALGAIENDPDLDRVDAVVRAWRDLAVKEPVLCAVLDSHLVAESGPVRQAAEREQQLLALAAGLAETTETGDEVSRVGAAFLTLIRNAPAARPTRRRKLAFSR